jgi:hypothetical protein
MLIESCVSLLQLQHLVLLDLIVGGPSDHVKETLIVVAEKLRKWSSFCYVQVTGFKLFVITVQKIRDFLTG